MAKKVDMTSKDYRKLDKVSRKKVEINEQEFIDHYGHLRTSEFLTLKYDLNENVAVYEPFNSLVTFIVELGESNAI